MKIVSAEQMKQIDRLTQEIYGVPGLILMERAALAMLEVMKSQFGELAGKQVFIFCGKGNNGGDGLALARLLRENEAKVTVVPAVDSNLLQGLAHDNLVMVEKFGIRLLEWTNFDVTELNNADILIDALLGIGASGAPSETMAEIIKAINQVNKPVLAVDIPSGINVETGQINEIAVKATVTVTFGLPKPGLICYPGAEYAGNLIVKEIGFPKHLLESDEITTNLLTASDVRCLIPERSQNAHKGSNGHVLVIGGSQGMTGALVLASLGALRAGCGLVTAGLRVDLPFPEKPAEILVSLWPDLIHQWDKFDCIVFGPGLSKMEDGESFLYDMLDKVKAPVLVDADGLNILAGNKKIFKSLKQPLLLTPHPGEMSRLTGLTVSEIQADRIGIARRFAAEWGVQVVLKGARTVIADPNGNIYLNPTGNPGMATGGTGDILAGIIGGLIAQGLTIEAAVKAGTYLHGLAGDLAAAKNGIIGLIAGDLLKEIPAAIKKVSTH